GSGVSPVYGTELWLWPQGLDSLDPRAPDEGWNLVLLVKDPVGYRNLCQLITTAIFDGMHFRPRIDLDLLRTHSDGLMALTGGLNGLLGRCDEAGARQWLSRLADIFDRENLFVELQDYGLPRHPELCGLGRTLASELDLDTVVTNDCRYLAPTDAVTLDLLNAIARAESLNLDDRPHLPTDQQDFKSEAQMRALFPDDGPALDRTVELAERCRFAFQTGTYFFPATTPPDPDPPAQEGQSPSPRSDTDANWAFFFQAFPPPRDYGMSGAEDDVPDRPDGAGNLDGYFEWFCREGLKKRLQKVDARQHDTYWKRLDREMGIIENMGFTAYLLIVAEFINWAKDHEIPVGPGRGSAAGSIAAWAMRITDIDPIRFGLLFERFLNPERVSMPDIDVDFCQDRREEVITHVREKYGSDLVSQIITYGKLQAKAALKDVARLCDVKFTTANEIASLVPAQLNIKLSEAIQDERFRGRVESDPMFRRVFSLARLIEGMTRQTGVHAAGVVIADRPLVEHAPLYRDGADGGPVVQYDMKSSESVGLIKFDFLGLKTLTVLDRTVKMLAERGVEIDLDRLALDDAKTYALLQRAET
ncbi:MAG: DNA polymerase III subunit alpha, partial [Myxococcota bacterium]|nr:DNA polymerase III subunit alpha [Myxococcota bacterium]